MSFAGGRHSPVSVVRGFSADGQPTTDNEMKPLQTTTKEVLRDAILSEDATRGFYQKLAERAATPEVRKKLLSLADGELVHRAKLESKYRAMFKEEPPAPRPVNVEIGNDAENLDMARAMKIAMERERDSESDYRFLAERVPDTELGALFLELAEIEWKHKVDLQNEYLAASGPDQFLMDI